MAEEITCYDNIVAIITNLDEQTPADLFDIKKIESLAEKMKGCRTVRGLVDLVDVDELNSALAMIDQRYNSLYLWNKVVQTARTISSNYSLDYMKACTIVKEGEDGSIGSAIAL